MALGAGLRPFKPGIFGGEERHYIIIEVTNAGFIIEGVEGEAAFQCASINPSADEVNGVDIATGSGGRAVDGTNCDNWAVAIGFFDVKFPAGRHAVIAQACPQLGSIPITWNHNRHTGRVRQHIAAKHDACIAAQVHFVPGIFGVVEVALGAGL